ncbi:MAG: argininosuccinate lyase [Fidelibacterota bacterium]|nr:MAG: argininosuccinate lyase [Candidatus Neomarinimicrobiota bacterium]
MKDKVWQDRFSKSLDPRVHALNRSLTFDNWLGPYDVQVSIVWSQALRRCEVIDDEELEKIIQGLEGIGEELEEGEFEFLESDEDIHMAIERRLAERIGKPADKLHHGRSRNDQVATDLRLFVMDHSDQIQQALRAVIKVLAELAAEYVDTPFPGHTHLQQAQVVSLGHLLLAHAWSLKSDAELLSAVASSSSSCPLGAAALGGSAAAVDREWIAKELGFTKASENSVEAVTSRDFVLDMLYGLSRLGVHLSRLAEDFILWNSQEFGFIVLDDSVATGSSLLAHKKNPDVFELARGKCGRLVGNHAGFLTTMKGLPLGYNKDFQEDKEPLFDSVDTVLQILPALEAALGGVTFQTDTISQALSPLLKAERIVQYLTERSVPFREAYGAAGRLVKEAENQGILLEKLPIEAYRKVSNVFMKDIQHILAEGWQIPGDGVLGGSHVKSVQRQIKAVNAWLEGR